MPSGLKLAVLGDFKVFRDRQPVPLPPSKKTRALLAYLAVVQRPQRRERLCEMFWEIPDDPRALSAGACRALGKSWVPAATVAFELTATPSRWIQPDSI